MLAIVIAVGGTGRFLTYGASAVSIFCFNTFSMIKIDLHTHSILSYDGGLRTSDYEKLFAKKVLDCIAITDHNEITFAQEAHKRFGEKVIVGEEIGTSDGEVIGLFLTKRVLPGLSFVETAKAIHEQKGIVYIPHPFEIKRSSVQRERVRGMEQKIDIVEVFNARGFLRGKTDEAVAFARTHELAQAAASDAHGTYGIGSAFSIIDTMPKATTISSLLKKGTLEKRHAPLWSLLYPTMNRLGKKFL